LSASDGFYRRWIEDYLRILAPITSLERKDTVFNWTEECRRASESPKTAFDSEAALKRFDGDFTCCTENAGEIARLFRHNFWKLYGLPDSSVSDRGTRAF